MYNYFDQFNLQPEEVIDYLRKSRTDDPLMSVDEILSKHEAMLDEWAEKNLGGKVPKENKFREVVSGETIADRPEIQRVLRMVESPRYKAILIVDVQRLSRGDLEDAGRLIKLLRYTNTLVITPQKAYDLRDEYDRDAFERELKRGNEFLEYTKKIMNRGRLLSVSQGNFINSTVPYGYDKTWVTEGKRKCPTLAINKEQAEVVRMIFDMYANKGIGLPNICHHLDSLHIKPPKTKYWSPSYVKDMLSNVHYLGKVRWNYRKTVTIVEDSEIVKTRPKAKLGEYLVYDGKHEAIITEELFNAAQERMGKNPRVNKLGKLRNPLAGLVWCQCGRAMTMRTYSQHDAKPRLLCVDQAHCHTGSCLLEEMMDIVAETLKQCISDFEIHTKNYSGDAIKMHENLLKSLEKKLQKIEARELAQWEAQTSPDPSLRMPAEVFKRLNENLLTEKEEVKEAINNARKSMPDPVEYQEKLIRFRDALTALQDPEADVEFKNSLLKECIERIDYNRDAPQRIRSNKKVVRKGGKRVSVNALPAGANWTNPPIQVDVKLKV